MSKTLEKSLIALMAATGLTVAEGPEVSFSGYFLGGMTGSWGDGLSQPGGYGAYNEIDLTTSVKFNEKATVDIYTTMYDGYSADAWWPEVYFDGITLSYAFTEDFTFYGGDLVFGAGDFGYYLYKRSYSVISETAVRGVGFSTAGLTAYTGMLGDEQWANYLGYEVPTPEGLSLGLHAAYYGLAFADEAPADPTDPNSEMVPVKLNVPDAIQAGATLGFEQDAFSLNATAGVMMQGSMTGFAVLVEPYYDMGMMNVLASFYMEEEGADEAFDENGDPVENGAMINDEGQSDMYFYVEPGFPITDALSFGVTLEYHDPDADIDEDQNFQTWPTLYLAPADDVLFLITAGMTQPLGDKDKIEAMGGSADASFGFGMELSGSF